jgi:pyridine nucleotide-disulfide oxidoreductase family protein
MKRLLLLGAGHAQLAVLAGLARRRMAEGVEVMLVSASARQVYSGMVPGLVAGRYSLEDCSIRVEPLAEAAGARFVRERAVALDAAEQVVTLSDGRQLDYDTLSLNTGPEQDRLRIPGAHSHALFLRPIESFALLWPRARSLADEGPIDVVVVGAGAAGVEIALAVRHSLGASCTVALIADGPVLDGYSPGAQRRALAALERREVLVLPGRCTGVEPGHALLGAMRVACDVPIMAVGGDAPAWLAGSGLALDAAGHVRVGPTLQSVSHPNVFAAGDVIVRDDLPHPRSGVYAVRAGPVLAENLLRFEADTQLRHYTPQARSLNLLALGDGRAIASWGAWAYQGRLMGWWKDRIDRGFVARYRRP